MYIRVWKFLEIETAVLGELDVQDEKKEELISLKFMF